MTGAQRGGKGRERREEQVTKREKVSGGEKGTNELKEMGRGRTGK